MAQTLSQGVENFQFSDGTVASSIFNKPADDDRSGWIDQSWSRLEVTIISIASAVDLARVEIWRRAGGGGTIWVMDADRSGGHGKRIRSCLAGPRQRSIFHMGHRRQWQQYNQYGGNIGKQQ